MNRKLIFALAGITLGMAVAAPATAGLNDELNGMLDGMMTNVTEPGTFETQRRGGISAGSITARNRITSVRPITIIPPSASAGCSGIDMFGGTFSYVNSDQLIALLRSVASNAAGYAFSLALDSICTSCMAQIKWAQERIQQLNQFSMSSCELAQGIVNDTVGAFGKKDAKTSASILQDVADFGDTWDSFWDTKDIDKHTVAQQAAPEAVEELVTGNLVWKALKRQNAISWFTYGDEQLLEAIMSVTGTVIVKMVEIEAGKKQPYSQAIRPLMKLENIVAGGEDVKYYRCDDRAENKCLMLFSGDTTTMNITGLSKRIREILRAAIPNMRPDSSGNFSATPTAEQKSLLTSLPAPYGQMIYRLAIRDVEAARQFVDDVSESMALDMGRQLLDEVTEATLASLATIQNDYAKQAMEDIKRVRNDLAEEYRRLSTGFNRLDNIQKYEAWMRLLNTIEQGQQEHKRNAIFDRIPSDPNP